MGGYWRIRGIGSTLTNPMDKFLKKEQVVKYLILHIIFRLSSVITRFPHKYINNMKKSDSMLGKWDKWYTNISKKDIGAFLYGDTETYKHASSFLSDMKKVEDWGCGTGGFKRYYQGKYIGIDGSNNPFVDKVVDLRKYKSKVDGIIMRHVLEHNYDWESILQNAIESFQKKFCLILFTPFGIKTKEIAHNLKYGVDVPDISFKRSDIEKNFKNLKWECMDNIPTQTGYGVEHIYYVEKK